MENQTIEFEIVTPQSQNIIQVEWIEIQSPTGNFVIGPNHRPLVSLVIRKGKLSYKPVSGNVTYIYPSEGIFIISNNRARALVDV